MSKAPQGALLLVGLPQQSSDYWGALSKRHGLTGPELAAMLGRTGSYQAMCNAWSRIKTGKHPISQREHALLLLELGEHPNLQIVTRAVTGA